MSSEDAGKSTTPDSRPSGLAEKANEIRARFAAELRAGRDPLVAIHRALIGSGLETGEEADARAYRSRFPDYNDLFDEVFGLGDPTVTLEQRDRDATDTALLFGLLALANGLVTPAALISGLDAWASEPGRSLREVLIARGVLDESTAGLVEALAGKHLANHDGLPWRSLMALGKSVRLGFDPGEVGDSELRAILSGFARDRAASDRAGEADRPGRRFEILREHARGGLGVVSLALDEELHREVALKEIRPDCADHEDYRARFLREAEVTGRLEHPGIVPVSGMGHYDDGRPYYVMRFIRGETLKDAIARFHKPSGADREADSAGRMDLHALLGRFVDACHAVAYAHHRKVLHRDLKPINIMLGPYGETLVVDWGLAKTFDGPSRDESDDEVTLRPESDHGMTPTRPGAIGTHGFMSPEQAEGRLDELGPASDIYSLGVTLYCLVTGHAPFEGAGRDEFLKRAREGDFPRPRKVNPSVPPALEAICLEAMATRPDDRYPTAEALAEDLERWRAGQPVDAYPEPPFDRLARWARGHKTALAGAAVLLICTTIGLAALAVRERRANDRISMANEKTSRAYEEAEQNLAKALESQAMILGQLNGPKMAYLPQTELLRLDLAGRVMEFTRDLLARHPGDPGVCLGLARSCRQVANIARSVGQSDRPARLYSEAVELVGRLVAEHDGDADLISELANIHRDSGENFRMSGKPRAAIVEYRKALEALGRPGRSPDDETRRRDRGMVFNDLALALIATGRPAEALEAGEQSMSLFAPLAKARPAQKIDRIFYSFALTARACALRELGKTREASDGLEEAGRLARQLRVEVPDPDTRFALAAIRNEQGQIVAETRRPAEAGIFFDEGFRISGDLMKAQPNVLHYCREVAVSLNGRGAARLDGYAPTPAAAKDNKEARPVSGPAQRIGEARKDCEKAQKILLGLDKAAPGHYEYQGLLGQTLANLGRIALAEDDRPKAHELLKQALASHQAALRLNPDSPDDKRRVAAIDGELERFELERAMTLPAR